MTTDDFPIEHHFEDDEHGYFTLSTKPEVVQVEADPQPVMEQAAAALEAAGLTGPSISKRIMEAEDTKKEFNAIFGEAQKILGSDKELQTAFLDDIETLMVRAQGDKRLREGAKKAWEGIKDLSFFGQDVAVGAYQLLLKRFPTLRRAGSAVAENINHQKNQKHVKGLIKLVDECRVEGKEHLRKRGG